MRTGEKYLLDTNIIIDFFRGDPEITSKLPPLSATIPSIVVGELFYGANLSAQSNLRIQQVTEFIENYEVLKIDKETSKYYGELKADLKRNGSPVPENDIWIAALSSQHSLILATRDHHFEKVKLSRVEFW